MESFEFRAAFHVCSWLRECHSFDRKTTELIQLFQYTTTRSLMIFSVYVRMNNIITRKIERLRALITLAVCTRPNFRRFVPLRFCVAKIWPGTRLYCHTITLTTPSLLSHPHTNHTLSHSLTIMVVIPSVSLWAVLQLDVLSLFHTYLWHIEEQL